MEYYATLEQDGLVDTLSGKDEEKLSLTEEEHGHRERHWCPINQRYFDKSEMAAVHIIPPAVGEFNCAHLFGKKDDGTEHLFDPRNGLLVHKELEAAMVRARIAIVPCDERKPSSRDLKVAVLDRSILARRHYSLVPRTDLEHRPLVFKNANRPRERYLEFAFLVTLLRRRRYDCTGWRNDLSQHSGRKPWASLERLPRGATMGIVARRMRHQLSQETPMSH